jgi:hypothetical protein
MSDAALGLSTAASLVVVLTLFAIRGLIVRVEDLLDRVARLEGLAGVDRGSTRRGSR